MHTYLDHLDSSCLYWGGRTGRVATFPIGRALAAGKPRSRDWQRLPPHAHTVPPVSRALFFVHNGGDFSAGVWRNVAEYYKGLPVSGQSGGCPRQKCRGSACACSASEPLAHGGPARERGLEGVVGIISVRHTLRVCECVRKKHVRFQARGARAWPFQPMEKSRV